MNTYAVTLHDDHDWQYTLTVQAASIQDARENSLVLDSMARNDTHIVSVRPIVIAARVDIS